MKYNKDEKKLTYEMKMPGDAWMGHVNDQHNGAAINPVTIEGSKSKWSGDVQQRIDDAKQNDQLQKGDDLNKAKNQDKQKEANHDHSLDH